VAVESSGQSPGNPRLYELFANAPKTGRSPTIWAWPELIDYLKVAGQPVQGPWPPHQRPRPDPEAESLPVAIPDPESVRPSPAPPAATATTAPIPLPDLRPGDFITPSMTPSEISAQPPTDTDTSAPRAHPI
jgi:hypothetical protein